MPKIGHIFYLKGIKMEKCFFCKRQKYCATILWHNKYKKALDEPRQH